MTIQCLLFGCFIGAWIGAWMQGFSVFSVGMAVGCTWSMIAAALAAFFGMLGKSKGDAQ